MRLERVNPDRNEYRFYELHVERTLFSDFALVIVWGRIGQPARQRIARTGPFKDIEAEAARLEGVKMRRGYHPRPAAA